jgi:phosphonatase-like hydrolase
MLKNLKLVVFDMSGTTVKDYNEVVDCFYDALVYTGINTTKSHINTMMGWSKIEVFETFWREELKGERTIDPAFLNETVQFEAQNSFRVFKDMLEEWYEENRIEPTEGCLDLFHFLKENDIKIALNTGFYREVADQIFQKLNWQQGNPFDFSITSDEVEKGRPAPFMIQKAMEYFGITDPRQVAKIGDTPSDLQEGRAAGVWSFGVTNGTHTWAQLEAHDYGSLFESQRAFMDFLQNSVIPQMG